MRRFLLWVLIPASLAIGFLSVAVYQGRDAIVTIGGQTTTSGAIMRQVWSDIKGSF